jgi:hypothetical protein
MYYATTLVKILKTVISLNHKLYAHAMSNLSQAKTRQLLQVNTSTLVNQRKHHQDHINQDLSLTQILKMAGEHNLKTM